MKYKNRALMQLEKNGYKMPEDKKIELEKLLRVSLFKFLFFIAPLVIPTVLYLESSFEFNILPKVIGILLIIFVEPFLLLLWIWLIVSFINRNYETDRFINNFLFDSYPDKKWFEKLSVKCSSCGGDGYHISKSRTYWCHEDDSYHGGGMTSSDCSKCRGTGRAFGLVDSNEK